MRGIYRNVAHIEKKLLGFLDSGMFQLFAFARLGARGGIVMSAYLIEIT